MSILKQNPFRVLGIFGNSSEREIQKQIEIIKRYAEIGRYKSFDYDFEFIGNLSREPEDIQQAASKIEQAKKKLHYSFFWFIKNNQFDEIAFNQLKNKNIEKAIEIWNKTLKGVSEKNISSYVNLATLHLALFRIQEQVELQHLQKAIELKGKLINSDFINNYISLITGNGIQVDTVSISKSFAEEVIDFLKPQINKKDGLSVVQLISLFKTFPTTTQKFVSDKFTEAPASNIELKIEKTAKKRKNNPENADETGEELFLTTKADIESLKKILERNNLQLEMIINKLANEILQCSIEYFNFHNKKKDIDPGERARKIVKYAGSLGATGQVKQRISENSNTIQKWIDDKPNRRKQEVVKDEIAYIDNKFKWFVKATNSIENAHDLIIICKPKLLAIKNKLGRTDNLYLQLSSLLVNASLNMIINVVNREQNQLKYDRTKLFSLPKTISNALSLMKKMESFDMSPKVRTRFKENKQAITTINNQLRIIRRQRSTTTSDNCYIATMAYGSINHPQVVTLRKFRDKKLEPCLLGRYFIRLYYYFSPHLVDVLKGQNHLNKAIRSILDYIIKLTGS